MHIYLIIVYGIIYYIHIIFFMHPLMNIQPSSPHRMHRKDNPLLKLKRHNLIEDPIVIKYLINRLIGKLTDSLKESDCIDLQKKIVREYLASVVYLEQSKIMRFVWSYS